MAYEGANSASLQREYIPALLLYLYLYLYDCMKCLAELCGENDFDAFLQAR